MEKFLDTVAICPGQIGQHAALWGMRNLGQWLAGERDEILARRAAIEAVRAAVEAVSAERRHRGVAFAVDVDPQ